MRAIDAISRADAVGGRYVGGRYVGDSAGTGGAPSDWESSQPSISADGSWIAYASFASNLVAGDTSGWFDVFVTNRATGETTRISAGQGGEQPGGDSWGPSISANGRWITFWSQASDLVPEDANGVADVFVTVNGMLS